MLLHARLRQWAEQRRSKRTENGVDHHRRAFEDRSLHLSDDDTNLRTELSIIPFEHS